jgi:hypothetical protein
MGLILLFQLWNIYYRWWVVVYGAYYIFIFMVRGVRLGEKLKVIHFSKNYEAKVDSDRRRRRSRLPGYDIRPVSLFSRCSAVWCFHVFVRRCFIALQRDGGGIALLVCRTRTLEGGTRKGLYLGMRKYSASLSLYLVYFRRAARNLHIEVNIFV